jgi:hypothetical protein
MGNVAAQPVEQGVEALDLDLLVARRGDLGQLSRGELIHTYER